ncbi:MAG: GH3 auxin-responsive promoter family protein [Deltaproteobacteria bacterium]|nr:GH3 auxin-responsive promoter family protein [Deltaproteobacteria bacterium]
MLKALVSSLLQARRARGFARFRARCHDVAAAQEALLLRLVARNGETALARRLGVPAVRRLEDLRRLPITDYDAIAPEREAALAGRPDQLVRGRPGFFGMTSGTSGFAKYIPIDAAYRAEFQGTVQHFLYGIVKDHPRALAGKALYMVAPAVIQTTPGGEPAGAITGYNLRRLPALLRRFYAVPADAFEVADPARQLYAVARFALAHELSIAFAVTTAPLAMIGQTIERDFEALLRDIHDGTLLRDGIAAPLHASLVRGLRPDPRRARALAARVSGGRRPVPRHLFPAMKVIACWSHAGAASRLEALRDVWGDVPIRPAIYSATEGWMNVPLADDRADRPPSGVLAVDAVVLELMDAAGRTSFAHEVREPGRYEILLTSGAGLWRYRLGDEVEVTGGFEAPGVAPWPAGRAPELHFVQKTGNVLSLAHDMTTEAHVRRAVAVALPDARRWVFGPSPNPDRYRIVVEGPLAGDLGSDRAAALDAALQAANMGYLDFRGDGQLQPLELVVRTSADFDAWEARRRGAAVSQSKPVVFVKSPDELPG